MLPWAGIYREPRGVVIYSKMPGSQSLCAPFYKLCRLSSWCRICSRYQGPTVFCRRVATVLHVCLPPHAMIQATIPPSQLQHQPKDHCGAGSSPTAWHGRDPRFCPTLPASRPVEQGLSMLSRRRQFLAVEIYGQVILCGLGPARQQENRPRICRRARNAGTGKERRGETRRFTCVEIAKN